MTGEAVHIHPDVFNHVFGYKNEGNKRITLAVAKTGVRMLRVRDIGTRRKGEKGRRVYPRIRWKFYIIHSLTTLELLYVRVATALSIQTFTDHVLSGHGRYGNEDRDELTV